MWASGKEFAEHRGVHPSRVSQWKRQKRLVLGDDGRINIAASDAALDASLDQAKANRTRLASSSVPVQAPLAPSAPQANDDDRSDYWESKAQREAAEAALAQLRLQEK